MSKRPRWLLVIALFAALPLLVVIVAFWCFGANESGLRSQATRAVGVIIAKRHLAEGTTIPMPEDMFERKAFLKGEEPLQGIQDFELLRDRVLRRSLRAGDYVCLDDLEGSPDPCARPWPLRYGCGSSWLLPGLKYVAFHISKQEFASGFMSPPDRVVDIVLTVKKDDGTSSSHLVLEDVFVSSADYNFMRDQHALFSIVVKCVDKLKIDLARQWGDVRPVSRRT